MLKIGWFSWNSLLVSCQSSYLSCYILSLSPSVTMWWHWKSWWSSVSLWTGYLGFKSWLRLATWMRLFVPVYSLSESAGRVMSQMRPWVHPSKALFINHQTIWCYIIWSIDSVIKKWTWKPCELQNLEQHWCHYVQPEILYKIEL